MAKKYYWVKLKDDFFMQKTIKKLRRIAGGDTYTVVYLKLQLLSIKSEGKLIFEGIEDTFARELSLIIDEDPENISVTLVFLEKYGLLEMVADNEFVLPEAVRNTGSEGDSAERMRNLREREKGKTLAPHCNAIVTLSETNVQKSDTEIDKEKENRDQRTETEVHLDLGSGCCASDNNILSEYREAINKDVSFTVQGELKRLVGQYSQTLVSQAIHEAARKDNLTISYLEGILKNWAAKQSRGVDKNGTNATHQPRNFRTCTTSNASAARSRDVDWAAEDERGWGL